MKRQRMEIKEEIEEDIDENPPPPTPTTTNNNNNRMEELRCEMCGLICQTISQLQTHTLTEHLPKRKLSSPYSSSSPSKVVCCSQCDSSFDSFPQFAAHMKSHLSTPQSTTNDSSPTTSTLYCPACPLITFPNITSRLEHITTQHLQIRINQYVCNECETSYSTSSALSNHFAQSHLRIKYECANCEFETDNEKIFKEHYKDHSRQDLIFGCASCGCTFPNQQLLITHVQLCHDQDCAMYTRNMLSAKPKMAIQQKSMKHQRILQCSVCDESVLGEDGLDEHRLMRHCKVRYADKCADCHENIDNETSFVEHCARHSKDMTFHCPVCRQSLRSETQIHAHKTYHMTKPIENGSLSPKIEECVEDPITFTFVCPICGEKFTDALTLIEHSKIHDDCKI